MIEDQPKTPEEVARAWILSLVRLERLEGLTDSDIHAGIQPLIDLISERDRLIRGMEASIEALRDEIRWLKKGR